MSVFRTYRSKPEYKICYTTPEAPEEVRFLCDADGWDEAKERLKFWKDDPDWSGCDLRIREETKTICWHRVP